MAFATHWQRMFRYKNQKVRGLTWSFFKFPRDNIEKPVLGSVLGRCQTFVDCIEQTEDGRLQTIVLFPSDF